MHDESITAQLEAFGLTSTEASLYVHLLSKPPKTILELARELGLPRTSVYDNAVRLAEKGLVQKIVTFKSQKLKAYPLSILQTALDKEKARVEGLQGKLTELEANLAHTLAVPTSTEVRYYYGPKGFQQMIWNALKATETVGYSEFGRYEVVGERFSDKYTDQIRSRGIKDRVICNPTPETVRRIQSDPDMTDVFKSATIRALPIEKLYVSGDITIYNDTYAVQYWKQGEVVGVEIENAELVKTQLALFELVWATAEPIAKYLQS